MKKLLCMLMALMMALGCAALAEESDLQQQLDAANARIEELEAQVETYYPFYFAQVVATYGEDGVIWLADVEAEYELFAAQYASFGVDLEAYGLADAAKMDIINTAVENAVILEMANQLGLDQFDAETEAGYETAADELMEQYISSYTDYFYPDMEVTDEMRAEAIAYWETQGISREIIIQTYKESDTFDAVYEYITKDVTITEEDTVAAYATLVEENKTSYGDDRTYNSDRCAGVPIAWNPEGYRAVKHVLIMFDDDQAQRYGDLQQQLATLNEEKAAIENPVEGAEAPARTIEEVNADIDACNAELDDLYAELQPTADEVIAAFNNGTGFDELIVQYNADPGMQNGVCAEIGYAVTDTDDAYWDPAFVDGAMSIANKGEISGPVYGMNGIHIIYYMDDIPAGEVGLEAIRPELEASALEDKINATYLAQVDAWMAEMNVQYYYDHFGVTTAA